MLRKKPGIAPLIGGLNTTIGTLPFRARIILLRLLVQHAGKVLTHRVLLNELWTTPIDAQYLRVYDQIRLLRQ